MRLSPGWFNHRNSGVGLSDVHPSEEGTAEVGAPEIRTHEDRPAKTRPAQVCPAEVCSPEIRPKTEIDLENLFFSPPIPSGHALPESGEMFRVCHGFASGGLIIPPGMRQANGQ